jgi:hypothetical protein
LDSSPAHQENETQALALLSEQNTPKRRASACVLLFTLSRSANPDAGAQ